MHICTGRITDGRTCPLLTPVRLHTQVSSESRPPSHWSTHRPAPPKGRRPGGPSDGGDESREPMVSSPKA